MNYNLKDNIDMAIKKCKSHSFLDDKYEIQRIYPFTTENISGYINNFDLSDKSLLTVGSSGDQVLNAFLHGSKDVTLLDNNPYAKYYYYLKIACILCLDVDEFMSFLRFNNFPKDYKKNRYVFNKETYKKIKMTLKSLDYDSYVFWNELFKMFKPITVRNSLFSYDEYETHVISKCNDYLGSDKNYNRIKQIVKDVNPNFIYGDLFALNLKKTFDNIWLSNIGTYLSHVQLKIMTDKMSELLNKDSKLLISYLFNTLIDKKYKDSSSPIYDLEATFDLLRQYEPLLISFDGIDELILGDSHINDSVLIYHKH